ncbi:hypothetical protein BC940DRAFT_349765 [Gongronella butleri]|nr:hypothetical protein BC940DRAFT_349765 [Gongronella butleri]
MLGNQHSGRSSTPASTSSMEEDPPMTLSVAQPSARARRFSEKLHNLTRKSPSHRYPSPTWTCMDEDMRSPERIHDDDGFSPASNTQFTPFQLSSPMRMDIAPDMSSPSSSSWPHTHQNYHSSLLQSQIQSQLHQNHQNHLFHQDYPVVDGPPPPPARKLRRLRDRMDVTPTASNMVSSSDSPSLSAKPKRRKLKQQRTTAWRVGNDAILDTTRVVAEPTYLNIALPAVVASASTPVALNVASQPRQHLRRQASASLVAKEEQIDKDTVNTPNASQEAELKTGNDETEVQGAQDDDQDDDDDDDDEMDVDKSGNYRSWARMESPSPNPTISWPSPVPGGASRRQFAGRSIRRKDTVEDRLTRLLHARDNLDLSKHSVLPQSAQEPPQVVIIPDDDDGEKDQDIPPERDPHHPDYRHAENIEFEEMYAHDDQQSSASVANSNAENAPEWPQHEQLQQQQQQQHDQEPTMQRDEGAMHLDDDQPFQHAPKLEESPELPPSEPLPPLQDTAVDQIEQNDGDNDHDMMLNDSDHAKNAPLGEFANDIVTNEPLTAPKLEQVEQDDMMLDDDNIRAKDDDLAIPMDDTQPDEMMVDQIDSSVAPMPAQEPAAMDDRMSDDMKDDDQDESAEMNLANVANTAAIAQTSSIAICSVASEQFTAAQDIALDRDTSQDDKMDDANGMASSNRVENLTFVNSAVATPDHDIIPAFTTSNSQPDETSTPPLNATDATSAATTQDDEIITPTDVLPANSAPQHPQPQQDPRHSLAFTAPPSVSPPPSSPSSSCSPGLTTNPLDTTADDASKDALQDGQDSSYFGRVVGSVSKFLLG